MASPANQNTNVTYSYAVRAKATLDIPLGGATDYTWNGFQRLFYEKATAAIQRQADILERRGNITAAEARQLVEVQRNSLVLATRDQLTPFGKYYSEILKPTKDLKTFDLLLAEKGSIEAVIRSVGKSRQAVNRVAFVARRVGPAAIVLDIVLTIVIIDQAPAAERQKMAVGQVGGMAGSLVGGRYGGWAGAWAGATIFSELGAATLTIPVVGEITEGGAVVIGGIVGFFFGGVVGWGAGQVGGPLLWRQAQVVWKQTSVARI
jgi:hypothetical protein